MSEELTNKLNYHFNNEALLKMALTHRSSHEVNNERLEFLGDSIVNFVIAEALYHQFPDSPEGELSRWRATLINRETLAMLAREFTLGKYLYLGPGELKSGGSERSSILSCGMEAIIGAMYLDGGFEKTKNCVMEWYEPLLQNLSNAASHKDPKTLLQERLQAMRKSLPIYIVENIEGEAHNQIFIVSCTVSGIKEKSIGKGTSRRRAEQDAAEIMLGNIRK
ncbi:MAG: ribonuclease III [Gammaproteobacteria bacterium]|nr:ribonuclease III [Gammaproteobacteria bacterium]